MSHNKTKEQKNKITKEQQALHNNPKAEPRRRTPKENKFPTGQASSLRGRQVRYGAGKLYAGRGVSLYLAIVILAVLLAISLGLSSILIIQIKMIRGMEESVVAFYVADTGIERELYVKTYLTVDEDLLPYKYSGFLDLDGNGQTSSGSCPAGLSSYPGDACYEVTIVSKSPCVIQSVGVFRDTRRAIEVRQ